MNKKCGWCKADTKPMYVLNDGSSLCVGCAEKHLDTIVKKLNVHIEQIQKGIQNRRKQLVKLKQQMCQHENLIDTGYCKTFSPTVIKTIYRCEHCKKTIYK